MLLALPVIVISYVLPVGLVLASATTEWTRWQTGALPALAYAAVGAGGGHALPVGAGLGAAGLFLSPLPANSRPAPPLGRGRPLPPGGGPGRPPPAPPPGRAPRAARAC